MYHSCSVMYHSCSMMYIVVVWCTITQEWCTIVYIVTVNTIYVLYRELLLLLLSTAWTTVASWLRSRMCMKRIRLSATYLWPTMVNQANSGLDSMMWQKRGHTSGTRQQQQLPIGSGTQKDQVKRMMRIASSLTVGPIGSGKKANALTKICHYVRKVSCNNQYD